MYYFNITNDACIGGKNDAILNDVLIEIKTRTRKQNVRRNEYDLYQLICYLLATGINKGKIVQVYNQVKYDSDIATEQEYGLVNILEEPWGPLSVEIVQGLKEYFKDLTELINTGNFIYLNSVIPGNIRPIARYTYLDNDNDDNYNDDNDDDNDDNESKNEKDLKKIVFCDENVKYKNLFRHLNK